jgi:CCR4-NOT transcriptional regulation complex NOT5 subunit
VRCSNIDTSGIIDTTGNIDRGTSISSGSNLQAIGGDSSVAIDMIDKSSQNQLAMTPSTSTTITDTGSHAIPDSPVLVDSSATNVPSKSIEMSKTTIVSATGAESSNLNTDSIDVDIKKKIEKASLNINLEAGRNTKTFTDKRTTISDSVVTNSNVFQCIKFGLTTVCDNRGIHTSSCRLFISQTRRTSRLTCDLTCAVISHYCGFHYCGMCVNRIAV